MDISLVINANSQLLCPHCQKNFELQEALTQKALEEMNALYKDQLEQERYNVEAEALRQARDAYEKELAKEKTKLAADLKDKDEENKQLQEKIKTAKKVAADAARAESSSAMKDLEKELAEKELKIAEFRDTEVSLRRQHKKLMESQAEVELNIARGVEEARLKVEEQLRNDFALKEASLNKKIEDAKRTNSLLTQKLEQGSQQLQGEILELELFEMLSTEHLMDNISEVKKGARGADITQEVCTHTKQPCGTIIWEIKRTLNWSNSWIPKLKDDMREHGADLPVLVSTVFPAGVEGGMLPYEGVWLVKPELAKGLSYALRTVLHESNRQKLVTASKNEGMEALYDYVCSHQFAQKIRAIVETYESMKLDLDKEKNAMQRLWKKREGQIERINSQMIAVSGDLQGLSVHQLEHLNELYQLSLD